MAKIGITLDEVLRDFIGQFHYTFEKYRGETPFELCDVDTFDLCELYGFKDKLEFNTFLYKQASLEIFGHADQKEDNIFHVFNSFIMDIEDETDHEVYIISREVNVSIPSTLFFLSKTLCKVENIKFVREYEDVWSDMDVLITANPITLDAKPEGRLAIKINHPYNKNNDADYDFDSTIDVLDVDIIEKLIK
jgi:hypothetical protein